MNIVIKRSAVEQLDSFKIKIKLLPGRLKVAILSFIIGLFVIFIYKKEFEIDNDGATGYFICAMIFFSCSFMAFRAEYKIRKFVHDFSKSFLKEYADCGTYSTINIDDSFFIYESLKKYNKFSWSSFSKYMIYNENIVLFLGEDYNSIAFVIKKNELTSEGFSELCNFISQRMTIKK